MKVTLADLRVKFTDNDPIIHVAQRQATLDDLIQVLEGMGAKRVWWCEEHDTSGDPAFDDEHCWEWTTGEEGELVKPRCSMVRVALVRIGDE